MSVAPSSTSSSSDGALAYEALVERVAHLERELAEARRRTAEDGRDAGAEARLRALQDVTRGLAVARTPEEVGDVVLGAGCRAMGAQAASVGTLVAGSTELDIRISAGIPDEVMARWQRYPLDQRTMLADAVRSGRTLQIGSLAAWEKAYPDTHPLMQRHGLTGAAAAPLRVGERVLGGIIFFFAAAHELSEGEVAFLEAIAGQTAQALERLRLCAEAEQRAAEIDATLTSMDDGLIVYRVDGTISYMNPAAQRTSGWPRERWDSTFAARAELLQLLTSDGTPLDPNESAPARALRGETVRGSEIRLKRADRVELWIAVSAAPMRTSGGAPLGAVAVLRDITERKLGEAALRESEQRFRVALEGSPIVVFSQDRDLRYTWVHNPSPGIRVEDVLGKRDSDLYEPRDAERFAAIKREVMATGVGRRDEVVTHRPASEGGDLVHDMTTEPLRDATGAVIGVVCAATDVTERRRAAEALAAGERRVRRLLEASPIGAAIGDLRGRTLYANDAALRTVGLSREAFEGGQSRWDAVTAPEHLERDRRAIEQALTAGVSEFYEKEYVHADGTRVPVLLACASLGDGEIAAFSIDVTQLRRIEKALRESEERFYKVFSQSPVPKTIATVEDGRCVVVNDAYARLVEYAPEELLSRSATELGILAPDQAERMASLLRERGRLRGEEVELRTKSGRRRTVLYFLVTTTLEGRPHAVSTLIDVTERRVAEDALREANARLEEADRRKNEFLAVLSHELRNPLAPITNSLHILGLAPPGGEQARRATDTIQRQVTQLSKLVDDLLDVTRISRNKVQLHPEALELNEVVRRAADDNAGLFDRGGIALELVAAPRPVPVLADRTRIMQVVGNLLQNAAKFTRPGGHTQVSVAVEGGEAVVRVRDDGVGIDRATLAHLFQPFMQADKTLDRSKGGLGLGLALVKALVELHGGRVDARSDGEGSGAELVVRLPLDATGTLTPRAPEPRRGPPPRRVLVIEDNVDAAQSLREVLQLDGHQVELACDGPRGLVRARELEPDVVLCDIGLPGMSGFEVAREFRADPSLRQVPLVALSGYALPEDLQRAAAAGFDHHLAKPPRLAELSQILANLPPRAAR